MNTATVITTEPLAVRRRHGIDGLELDFLPAGSVCELAGDDDIPGTFILIDDQGDEVWHVHPIQFRAATPGDGGVGGIRTHGHSDTASTD